jgi:hypothetical protein
MTKLQGIAAVLITLSAYAVAIYFTTLLMSP